MCARGRNINNAGEAAEATAPSPEEIEYRRQKRASNFIFTNFVSSLAAAAAGL